MAQSLDNARSVLLIALAGLASALLAIAIEPKLTGELAATVLQFDKGPLFGGSIAAYYVLHDGVRSIWKVLAFVAACAAADVASVFAAFGTESIVAHGSILNGSRSVDIPLPVFFGGGFTGAFIIFGAAVLLFGTRNIGWRSWGRTVLWAVGGGFLGIAGRASGPVLGRALWLILQRSHLRPSWETYEIAIKQQTPEEISLVVVWQVGVALSLGWMMLTERKVVSADSRPVSLARPVRTFSRVALTLVSVLFFLGIFSFLGWYGLRVVHGEQAHTHRLEALKKSRAEAPSVENLSPIQPMTVGHALMLEDLGGFFADEPRLSTNRGELKTFGDFAPVPPSIEYSVDYVPQKDAPIGSYQPRITAQVSQFPNAAWARYNTKYPSGFNVALNELKDLVIVTKFGNRIVMNTTMRYHDGGGRLEFLWCCRNVVVTLRYETREVNEEFLKRYLDKYPSFL